MTELQKFVDTSADNKFINIHVWAQSTLDTEELNQFREAEQRNNDLMESYVKHGLMIQEPIKENIYLPIYGEEITVTVGTKTILAPGVTILDIPIDPEYGAWHARYTADSNINYSPTVQI